MPAERFSKIIILGDDSFFPEIMPDLLPEYQLEFIYDPDQLQDYDNLYKTFNSGKFNILILSNLCIPIDIVKRHIFLIPRERQFSVLLMSGHFDDEINDYCRARSIKTLSMPFELNNFKEIIAAFH